MKTALVGYTGFVGSNILESKEFDALYNSKNIEEAYGTNPDLLVFAGLPAEKFIANVFPEKDYMAIYNAMQTMKLINPKKLVLISSIDVYRNPVGVNEESEMVKKNMVPYGENRLELENWIEKEFKDYHILRLPVVYGKNLKKNFIYDMINYIPEVLNASKYREISLKFDDFHRFYSIDEGGFYKCNKLDKEKREKLKRMFEEVGFSALSFTDSRAYYQFFNLKHLWEHIENAINNNIKKINMAVEPVRIDELFKYIFDKEFVNEVLAIPPNQNVKTKYDKVLGGKNGYLVSKKVIMDEIKEFVETNMKLLNQDTHK